MALNVNYRENTVNLNQQLPNSTILGKIPNYNSVSVRSITVKLNPASTQDFFASGEFLKKIGTDGTGLVIVDIVSAITDDVFCILEATDPVIQKEKIVNGGVVKVYYKGDIINAVASFNESVDIMVQNAEALVAGDLVQVSATGDKVEKITTGKQCGVVRFGNSTANKSATITLTKI